MKDLNKMKNKHKETLTKKITKLIKDNGVKSVIAEVLCVVYDDHKFDHRYTMILDSTLSSLVNLSSLIDYEDSERERKSETLLHGSIKQRKDGKRS